MESFGFVQRCAPLVEEPCRSRTRTDGVRHQQNPCLTFLSSFVGGNSDSQELRRLYQLASKIECCSGKLIFSEGEHAASAFGLARGYVRLYRNTPEGRRQIVAFAQPGDFLGMPFAEVHKYSADAIDQVVLCRFPRAEFTSVIQSAPTTMRQLISFATAELERAQQLSMLLGHTSAEKRIIAFLIDWRDRLARLGPPSQFVPLPMMRQDIADFLGLTPATVCRVFAKLEARNVIRVAPKGVVLNQSEL